MLARRVGLVGATGIGVGSMLGAGVFVVWGPAAAAAGPWLPWAVLVAGAVAALNAASTAQLAAVHPLAGGAYAYGRLELGPWPGFIAGWAFVVGKTASIAAMGLAIGAYVWPGGAAWVATMAIAGSWLLNSRGITRTSAGATAVAAVVVAVLVLVVAAAIPHAGASGAADFGWHQPGGALAAAPLLFFAFAGYARVATLGEEVRDPARVIPRAIALALSVVLALALVLAWTLEKVLGAELAVTEAPLADAVAGTWLPEGVVAGTAALAAGGALLALTAGVGRTAMAMAREGDLPSGLALSGERGVPVRAEAVVAVCAVALAWSGDLTWAIGLSSFAVLAYYAIAGAAAFRAATVGHVPGWHVPRPLSALGVVSCLALMAWLPVASTALAVALIAFGCVARLVVRRARSRHASRDPRP